MMMETSAFGIGLAEVLLLLFSGQFLGLVPGERDPLLIKSPPAETYFYQEWTAPGAGTVGAPGVNGLAADPEIQAFVTALLQTWKASDGAWAGGESEMEFAVARELPMLLALAARHPGAVYAANGVPRQDDSWLPFLQGALILNLGDDAAEFVAGLNRLFQSVPGFQSEPSPHRVSIPLSGKPLLLHQEGPRLLIATSPAVLDQILRRWQAPQAELPKHAAFSAAWQQARIEQFGSVAWINLAKLRADLPQNFGLIGGVIHNVCKPLGVTDIESIITVTGTEQQDQLGRTQIMLTGERGGLLKLLSGRALAPADFAHIPADADFVAASTLNLETFRDTVREIVLKTAPEALAGFEEFQRQLELELQLSLDDITTGFGDVWTMHDSPANGGLILTGLVAGVPVKDFSRAERVVQRLQNLLIESLPPEEYGNATQLCDLPFQGTTIHYLQRTGDSNYGEASLPFSPAFCLTKTHLWIALHPQALKAQLRFLDTNEPRFDAAAKLKRSADDEELLGAVYLDTPRIGRTVYPLVPLLAKTALARSSLPEGAFDLGSIPSARAVLPYLRETSVTAARNPAGLRIEQRNMLPVYVSLLLLPYLHTNHAGFLEDDGMMPLGRRNRPGNEDPAVNLGAAEGEVVQAKVEEPPKPQLDQPTAVEKAARRTLPFVVRSLIPDQVEGFIPNIAFEKMAEPPDPEKAAQRAAERERRREERAARRAAKKVGPR